MYNRKFLEDGHDEIEAQILAMPGNYVSLDFCTGFEENHPQLRENFIRFYMSRGHSRPHAIQIVHSQLMHTVNDRFHHLTRKIRTVPNPRGGDMSEWVRL
jgi:hypothetical protein